MSNSPRILILEDDPLQAGWLTDEVIWPVLPEAEILYFDSECSFLEGLSKRTIQDWQPEYAIMDLLVRYYSPRDLAGRSSRPDFDGIPDPKEAGIRCRKRLLAECPKAETVIVTVLDSSPENCRVIRKGDEKFAEELIQFLGAKSD